MKKRLIALLLVLGLSVAMTACGTGTANEETASGAPAQTAASPAEEPVEEAEVPTEVETPAEEAPASSEEADAPAEPEEAAAPEPAHAIEYPIPGEHEFTMVSVLRMNAAEACARYLENS